MSAKSIYTFSYHIRSHVANFGQFRRLYAGLVNPALQQTAA